MKGYWLLNNKDMYEHHGAVILKGSYAGFMEPPTPKARLEFKQIDAHGTQVDEASPLYCEEKKYSFDVLIVGNGFVDFWAKWNRFFDEINTPQSFSLYIADLGLTVHLLYEGGRMLKKPARLRSGRVAVSYRITVKEANPNNRQYAN